MPLTAIKNLFSKKQKADTKPNQPTPKDTKKSAKGKHGEDFCCGGCS